MSLNRPQIRLALGLVALAATGLLGACASSNKPAPAPHAALTPTEQYPLRAREIPSELKLAVHADGLSSAQRDALADMADRWTQSGGGDVTIRVPTVGVDQHAADLTSREAVEFLGSMGVPEARVRRVGYVPAAAAGEAPAPGPAPIVVAYLTYRAMVQRCGLEWENLSTNTNNRPMQNFGCAISANLAAQIANPADLAAPRALDPADAGRRITVLGKYRQGQITAGDTDRNASASVSSIGGSN